MRCTRCGPDGRAREIPRPARLPCVEGHLVGDLDPLERQMRPDRFGTLLRGGQELDSWGALRPRGRVLAHELCEELRTEWEGDAEVEEDLAFHPRLSDQDLVPADTADTPVASDQDAHCAEVSSSTSKCAVASAHRGVTGSDSLRRTWCKWLPLVCQRCFWKVRI